MNIDLHIPAVHHRCDLSIVGVACMVKTQLLFTLLLSLSSSLLRYQPFATVSAACNTYIHFVYFVFYVPSVL